MIRSATSAPVRIRPGDLENAGSEASVGVELQAVDAAAWVVELRCIGPVECFGAEFEIYSLGHRESAEEAEVGVKCAGASKAIEAGGAEARLSHIGEGGLIVVWLANTDSTELFTSGLT